MTLARALMHEVQKEKNFNGPSAEVEPNQEAYSQNVAEAETHVPAYRRTSPLSWNFRSSKRYPQLVEIIKNWSSPCQASWLHKILRYMVYLQK